MECAAPVMQKPIHLSRSHDRMQALIGVGVDICHAPRVVRLLDRYGERFLARAFAPSEIDKIRLLKSRGSDGEAALLSFVGSRWAAKEAFFKAVRGRWRVAFPEIELAPTDASARSSPLEYAQLPVALDGRTANNSPGPHIRISGVARKECEALGVSRAEVSISHDGEYCAAFLALVADSNGLDSGRPAGFPEEVR